MPSPQIPPRTEKRREYARQYYHKNKEKFRAYCKRETVIARRRQTQLMTVNGIVRGLTKRVYTDNCELCGLNIKRLHYHHWDNNKPSQGLWLCAPCHWFVGGVERNLQAQRYIDLKHEVENGIR